MIASMLGFSNAFYDETKMINDIKFGIEQEQIIDDEEPKDWLVWCRVTRFINSFQYLWEVFQRFWFSKLPSMNSQTRK